MQTVAPLRARLFALLGEPEGEAGEWEAFVSGDAAAGLTAWFGRDRLVRGMTAEAIRLAIDRDIAEIDDKLSGACDAILHHPRLQALEAGWRGIHWLTSALGSDGQTRLRLLDCRWAELARDLERAADFDQSALFDLVYNQEYGMPGGAPFAMLIGLYEIQHRPSRDHATDDVAVLRRLSATAAAAFSPIILGVKPSWIGAEGWGDLDRRAELASLLRAAEYRRYHAFRATPDARFIALVCSRILLRAPYRGRDAGDCGFRYRETVARAEDQVWGVGALAIAHIALRAFNDYRWLAAIRGLVQDELAAGLVVDLPAPDFETDAPGVIQRFPLELNPTEALERDLAEAGMIALRRCKDTPFAYVGVLPTAHRPSGAFPNEIARVNEQLGAMLNYVFCVSRFAHYIKVIAREWIGSFQNADDLERRLSAWLSNYCSVGEDLSFEMRARYPLEAAQVRVRPMPGQPGNFECVAQLKPHLQLDQAISEFQLVTLVQGLERQL